MDFNNGDLDGRNRISNGNGRMCISPRVKNDSRNPISRGRLQLIDEIAFVIALIEGQFDQGELGRQVFLQ